MAALGSTTFTSVTWTAGDVMTEAKLDNMVANDQAYDSHAAQGLLLNNLKGLAGKDSGGTNRDLIYIDGSDDVQFGDSNLGDIEVANPLSLGDAMPKTNVRFKAEGGSAQTIPGSTFTTLECDTEHYDDGSDYDISTYKFTAPVAGKYFFKASVRWEDPNTDCFIRFQTSGSADTSGSEMRNNFGAYDNNQMTVDVLELAASEEVYVEVRQNSGGNVDVMFTRSVFMGHLLST